MSNDVRGRIHTRLLCLILVLWVMDWCQGYAGNDGVVGVASRLLSGEVGAATAMNMATAPAAVASVMYWLLVLLAGWLVVSCIVLWGRGRRGPP